MNSSCASAATIDARIWLSVTMRPRKRNPPEAEPMFLREGRLQAALPRSRSREYGGLSHSSHMATARRLEQRMHRH